VKITKTSENIHSFGGLNFISNNFDKLGLREFIDKKLGLRSTFAKFAYSDCIKNYLMLYMAGGDCAEDIQVHLKDELDNVKGINACSADTLLRMQKELATEKEHITSKNNVVNQINTNEKLNELNLELLVKLRALNTEDYHDLDFDNQFIPCEKYDAKKSYKMKLGYFPSVATIGRNIVYIENRNGNSNVKFEQSKTFENIFNLLKKNKIKIGKARMDCGSFIKEVVELVESHTQNFYIRAQRCGELTKKLKEVTTWKEVTLNGKKVEICSVQYKPFGGDKYYRYVVSREANKTGQVDVFQEDSFIYRAIITNDEAMSDIEVIKYYNQRGASEKIFDEMNNDFGWKKLPFSFLEENTVFMSIMAICRNFFLHFLDEYSNKLEFIEKTSRLKRFIFRFVVLPYKWIQKGSESVLKLYTNKPYHLIN